MPASSLSSSCDLGRATGLSLPKKLVITAALLSLVMSVFLFFTGEETRGIFVGIWVPSILSLGNLILSGDAQ